MEIDNQDVSALFVTESLKRGMAPDEKLVTFNRVPMVVKKRWFERLTGAAMDAMRNAWRGAWN